MIMMGMLGGLLKAATLIIPLYLLAPASYSDAWLSFEFNETLRKLVYIPDFLLTIGAGYVAARFGWATRQQYLQAGMLAGTLSGMVAWLLIGSGTAGMAGSGPVLIQALQPLSDEAEMRWLLAETNIGIVWWLHLSFWGMVIMGAVLGTLGGWLYRLHGSQPWGGEPEPIHPTIWKALGMTVLFLATIQMFQLPTSYERTTLIATIATEHDISFSRPVHGIFAWPASVVLIALMVSAWWNWQWIAAQWKHPEVRHRRNAWSAAGFTLMLPLVAFSELGRGAWVYYSDPVLLLGFIGFVVVSLIGIYRTWRSEPPALPPAPSGPAAATSSAKTPAESGDTEELPPEDLPPSMKDWYDYLLIAWPLCASLVMLSSQGVAITLDIVLGQIQPNEAAVRTMINDLFATHTLGSIGVVGIPLIFALLFSLYSWLSNLVLAPRQE
jgi:hypothetical protein